jgi:hypothetical protein
MLRLPSRFAAVMLCFVYRTRFSGQ